MHLRSLRSLEFSVTRGMAAVLLLLAGAGTWGTRAAAEDVILLASTRLARTAEFDATLGLYQQALADSEGLSSRYVEVDSAACQNTYGDRVADLDNWRDVQRVLARIRARSGARYFLILGGRLVVPRPTLPLQTEDGTTEDVESDGWYLDFDGDRIVDGDAAIGRFADQGVAFGNPDVFPSIDGLLAALRTAIVVHLRGGFTLDNPIAFVQGEYETPPFGVGPECAQPAAFMKLLATADGIEFTGHGEINYFKNNDRVLMLDPEHLDAQTLQRNHPFICAWGPCNSARLLETWEGFPEDYPFPIGFPRDFQLSGAAAFIGRTTTHGFYGTTTNVFYDELAAGARIGDALFTAMRASAQDAVPRYGERALITAQHFCLYGDPTLRLTGALPCNAHKPVLANVTNGLASSAIQVNGRNPTATGRFGPFATVTDKLVVRVRPMQVGDSDFIQKSIRGLGCQMLVATNSTFLGKIFRVSGTFLPGHYPQADRYEFRLGPAQQAGTCFFRVVATNALGSASIPTAKFLYDSYTLTFTGKISQVGSSFPLLDAR